MQRLSFLVLERRPEEKRDEEIFFHPCECIAGDGVERYHHKLTLVSNSVIHVK